MRSTIFIVLASILLTVVSATNTNGAVQSWQQLAYALNISDPKTLVALKSATQVSNGIDATARALRACSISQVIFNGTLQAVDDLPEYISSTSTLYTNRTKVNWYVQRDSIIVAFLKGS